MTNSTTSTEARYRTIESFRRQYPNTPIRKWKHVINSDPDLITVYTDFETLTVQYNPSTKKSMIVSAIDGMPDDIAAMPIMYSSQKVKAEKPKGRISGCLAMILTILYAIYIILPFADFGMDTIGNYIMMQMIMPHMLCVTVAAIFSVIGFFGKKRWALLTSGILMSVSAVLMMELAPMVIVQAVLFFISYARTK